MSYGTLLNREIIITSLMSDMDCSNLLRKIIFTVLPNPYAPILI